MRSTPRSWRGSPSRPPASGACDERARGALLLPLLRRAGHPTRRRRVVGMAVRVVRARLRAHGDHGGRCGLMADADPRAPWHEPAMPVLDEEATWVHETAERFEGTRAEDLLEWALDRF